MSTICRRCQYDRPREGLLCTQCRRDIRLTWQNAQHRPLVPLRFPRSINGGRREHHRGFTPIEVWDSPEDIPEGILAF